MIVSSLIKKYWKVACVIVGCWLFMALLFTPQTYLSTVLTPVLLWLGQRFALEHPRLLRNLGIHLLLSGAGGCVTCVTCGKDPNTTTLARLITIKWLPLTTTVD